MKPGHDITDWEVQRTLAVWVREYRTIVQTVVMVQRCADSKILSPQQSAHFDQRSAFAVVRYIVSAVSSLSLCILPYLVKDIPELIADLFQGSIHERS